VKYHLQIVNAPYVCDIRRSVFRAFLDVVVFREGEIIWIRKVARRKKYGSRFVQEDFGVRWVEATLQVRVHAELIVKFRAGNSVESRKLITSVSVDE
jgi:hypothetical protein